MSGAQFSLPCCLTCRRMSVPCLSVQRSLPLVVFVGLFFCFSTCSLLADTRFLFPHTVGCPSAGRHVNVAVVPHWPAHLASSAMCSRRCRW